MGQKQITSLVDAYDKVHTPCEASAFNPGHGPRMSPSMRGFHGWRASLTSLVPLKVRGGGGLAGSRTCKVGRTLSSSSCDSPAKEA